MFNFFKKKEEPCYVLGSPAKGKTVALKEVNDPTFSEGMLGQGVAVLPSEGKFYAPADGEIGMVFDTRHAVSMVSANGVEILIHVGLDTVEMKGEGFEAHVKAGDQVKKGDLLLTVDLDKVKAAGYETITPVLVCNTDDYAAVEGIVGNAVVPGDDAVKIKLNK
ncbi:MAG: PTS glucose transporter subunit IIA [Clostridiales bacterium]|nr:PTS glucose transporter subunit IIA [Clostridiales bacterium]